MSATTPALIAAAAGVGFGHAILPDHWAPLAVVGRTRRYGLRRVARLSGLAGAAHVLVSLLLGAIIIAVGLQFRSEVANAQDLIVGGVLLLTGVGFGVLELSGHEHDHPHPHEQAHDRPHPHEQGHDQPHPHEQVQVHDHHHHHGEPRASGTRGLAAIMIPFGAAASPDLTILPVFVAATAAGAFAAIGALLVFSAVTIGTIVALTLIACFGGHQVQGRWLDRWGNLFTAAVLVTIGALVVTGLI